MKVPWRLLSDTGLPSMVSKYSLTEIALIPSCSNMSPKMTSMVVLQYAIFIVVSDGFQTCFAAHPKLIRIAKMSGNGPCILNCGKNWTMALTTVNRTLKQVKPYVTDFHGCRTNP